jgi:hypothetical protein
MSIAAAVLAAAVLLPLLAPSLACMSRCMHVEGAVAGEPCMVLRDTALAFVEDTRESMRLPVHVGCGVRLGDRHGTHLSVSILSYFAQGGDDAPQVRRRARRRSCALQSLMCMSLPCPAGGVAACTGASAARRRLRDS